MLGTCPAKAPMFVLFMSCDLAQSTHEHEANGLVYSKWPANTNDLAAASWTIQSFFHPLSPWEGEGEGGGGGASLPSSPPGMEKSESRRVHFCT